ncbi:hypothetical protein [Ectothiorhodospira variabilis]|uniref:hypothetical protein n=1 Tax=Ectothiorhodospira variabilis TaxID=505694 RepID=UPI001EFAC9CF|nr:hypothetical protein [Ectothiorhodospira variabilis]MCG5494410.1 hypothetical protein [Ectothiorhodospira variabilis]MCG5503219.1 hypothetical protein [Ectothiorhodospira variabilis]MCG5506022.1 hypothetical protein [Ectothiorhodospira variabilis]
MKLFKRKSWVTLEEAAQYLTSFSDENVHETDILRLALEGHLQLSVYLPNRVLAQACNPACALEGFLSPRFETSPQGQQQKDKIRLVGEGVWDLCLTRGIRVRVKRELQNRLGGGQVKLPKEHRGAVFLKPAKADQCFQVFQHNVPTPEQGLASIRHQVPRLRDLADDADLREVVDSLDLAEKEKWLLSMAPVPANDLPEEAILAVRTSALTELIEPCDTSELPQREERRTYRTEWLKIQEAAIEQFFDPPRDVDPKKDEVVQWIKEKAREANIGESDRVAQAMFTIIKPHDHNPKKRKGSPPSSI